MASDRFARKVGWNYVFFTAQPEANDRAAYGPATAEALRASRGIVRGIRRVARMAPARKASLGGAVREG